MSIDEVVQVDARRLLCPMPVIRVQDRVAGLPPGTRLEALCSDPGALIDIPAWCRIHGHRVIEAGQHDELVRVLLEVGPAE